MIRYQQNYKDNWHYRRKHQQSEHWLVTTLAGLATLVIIASIYALALMYQ